MFLNSDFPLLQNLFYLPKECILVVKNANKTEVCKVKKPSLPINKPTSFPLLVCSFKDLVTRDSHRK